MKTITVAQLRQNPTAALAEVEAGATFVVTRHGQPVARLVPPTGATLTASQLTLIPPRNPHAPRPAFWGQGRRRTYEETEALLAEMKDDR